MARNEEIITYMPYEGWEEIHAEDWDRKHEQKVKKAFHKAVKKECDRRMKAFYTDFSIVMVILAVPLCMVAHFFLSTGY